MLHTVRPFTCVGVHAGGWGGLRFVFKSLDGRLVLVCGQISNLSISAFPAVGVACELSPACPHWSHAGRRGVSVLCQQLTWCSVEGLLISSLSLSLSILSPPFLPNHPPPTNLKFGRTQWDGRRGATPHTCMNDLRDIQTLIVWQGYETFFSGCCAQWLLCSRDLICQTQKVLSSSARLQRQ